MASSRSDRVKAMAESGFARWSAKNPGGTRAEYSAYAKQRVSEMAARGKARKAAGSAKASVFKAPTAEQQAARDRVKAMSDKAFEKWSAKNPGATRADYTAYAKKRVADMSEAAWQKWSAKNPGATKADYRAYARQRVSDYVAKARSRKLSG